jgi:hypothetical protein
MSQYPRLGQPVPLLGQAGPRVGQSRYSGDQSNDPLRQSALPGERAGAFLGRRAGEREDRRPPRRAPREGLGESGDLLGGASS